MEYPDKRNVVRPKVFWVSIIFIVFFGLTFLDATLKDHQRAFIHDDELINSIPHQFDLCRIWLVVATMILAAGLILHERLERKKIPVGVFAGLFVFCDILVITRTIQFEMNVDDAYIYFRYIRNFIEFGQMHFNHGEAILGFTSHLYIWLLTPFAAIFGPEQLPLICRNINILLSLLNFLGSYAVLSRTGVRPAFSLAGAGFFSLSIYHIVQSTYGMEAELLVALMLGFLMSMLLGKQIPFAFLSVLIVFCRPEGIIVLVLGLIYAIRTWGWRSLRNWIIPAIGSAAYAAWLYNSFGTLLPHSVIAKSLIYRLDPDAAVKSFLSFFGQLFIGIQTSPWAGFFLLVAVLAIILYLAAGKIPLYFYFGSAFTIMGSFMVGNPLIFPWYYAWISMMPMLILPLLMEKIARSMNRWTVISTISISLLIAYGAGSSYAGFRMSESSVGFLGVPHPLLLWDRARERLTLYRSAARQLNASGSTENAIAVSEDGMFGYTFRGPVLTLDGLASKEMLNYYPLKKEQYFSPFAIAPRAVESLKPDRIVFFENFGMNSILKDAYFLRTYRLEKFWPLDLWGGRGLYQYASSDSYRPLTEVD